VCVPANANAPRDGQLAAKRDSSASDVHELYCDDEKRIETLLIEGMQSAETE